MGDETELADQLRADGFDATAHIVELKAKIRLQAERIEELERKNRLIDGQLVDHIESRRTHAAEISVLRHLIEPVQADNAKLEQENATLRELIDDFKCASMLEKKGDPADITPLDIETHITELRATAELVAGIRPCVLRFAAEMERKLKDNDHKPGWEGDDNTDLFERILAEACELRDALENSVPLPERVIEEAADIANFAMMIADNTIAIMGDPK